MTDVKKITELPEKSSLGDNDLIPIVDFDNLPVNTKKITLANAKTALKGDPGTSYIWRGNWVTSTAYALNDTVHDPISGNGYVCLFAHTSGIFASDLGNAYWGLYIQKGDKGDKGDTGDTGPAGANVNLLYGTSTTPPTGTIDDGTLYVTYNP